MSYTPEYYDAKWTETIKLLPRGGKYRLDMRQACFEQIKEIVKPGSKVFDFACGLGVASIQLSKEKGCKVYGCDYSAVAVEYVNMNIQSGEFRHTDKIFGDNYDYIMAIAFIEHIENPREWIDDALKYTKNLIVTIPNNYRQVGEHACMQWANWAQFEGVLEGLNWARVDDYGKHPTHSAWASPIILITKERVMHPNYREEKPAEVKKPAKKIKVKKEKTIKAEKDNKTIKAVDEVTESKETI
jgi:SAM-dependent methyltransferase